MNLEVVFQIQTESLKDFRALKKAACGTPQGEEVA